MYKGSSRNLIHATKVDTIDRAKAYIDSTDAVVDFIKDAEAMTREEATAEKARLNRDLIQVDQEAGHAKRHGDVRGYTKVNLKRMTIQSRLAAVNSRIKALNIERGDSALRQAVNELTDEALRKRIFGRMIEIEMQS